MILYFFPALQNSIRHNLSLYDIFVREKSTTHGQSGTSYWTLRSDVSEKSIKGSSSNRVTCSKSAVPSPVSGNYIISGSECHLSSCFYLFAPTFWGDARDL